MMDGKNLGAITEQIFIDGSYFISLLSDISQAKHSIDFETYIFSNDEAGLMLSSALINAAMRGVKIRVLVDGVGTSMWNDEFANSLQRHGIETRIYHPLPWSIHHWKYDGRFTTSIIKKFIYLLSKINSRDHRKLCLIDNSIVYVGSSNITEHLLNKKDENMWRETAVKVTGTKIEDLQFAFNKVWGDYETENTKLVYSRKILDQKVFQLNYSWRLRRYYVKSLISKISSSKHRVWITNAYFVPSYRILRSLRKAKKRGVEVVILLPKVSDILITSIAAKTFYMGLLKSDVIIYEYLQSILHAKSLIIDDWYLVGSSNLNHRSIHHDLELDVNIQSEQAKNILEKQFLIDIDNSKKVSIDEVGNQSILQYLVGRIILIFKYWI